MTDTIKPCPCGKVPGVLVIEDLGTTFAVRGSCCEAWLVLFSSPNQLYSEPFNRDSEIAWDSAPRGFFK